MNSYELAKKVYSEFEESGKKYVCLNGFDYEFLNEYHKKYELCTDTFYVILAYLKIYDPKTLFHISIIDNIRLFVGKHDRIKTSFCIN
jgi:hypothetical protein